LEAFAPEEQSGQAGKRSSPKREQCRPDPAAVQVDQADVAAQAAFRGTKDAYQQGQEKEEECEKE
jgi:hypothetical protein